MSMLMVQGFEKYFEEANLQAFIWGALTAVENVWSRRHEIDLI